jgi:hypothetical protein
MPFSKMSRREWLKTGATAAAASQLAASLPALSASGNSGKEPPVPWYRKTLVGIEVGPTGANAHDSVYMARATGKEIIENLVRAKVEYGVLFMKDMEFAYYNSKAAIKAPNLGDRDLLRECIEEAKPHGLPIVAYCQIQYDSSSWRAHPEWRMKGPDGKDLEPRLCFNSPYIDYIKTVADEMMAYEISGFHFDMLDFGFGPPLGCWCDRCRTLYREMYRRDMPACPTWDEAWDRMLEFRAASNTRFCRDLDAFVHSHRPEISVDFNYHGYPPFSWMPGELPVKHAKNGDFVTAEGLPFIFGHTNPSLLALFMKGARPDGLVQGVTSRSVYDYHDFTVRPTADMKWEVMTYLAHGAQCTIVDKANYDGTLDRLVYDRIGEIFGEARSLSETFGHKPVAEVGLYYSSRSRDWFAREDPPKYFAAFKGAHQALLQTHIAMGILPDEIATTERLKEFDVVYVPNAAVLSEKEVELLRAYASGGGKVLLTGLAGLCDQYGNLQDRSSISDLIGARLVKAYTEHPDNYLRLPKELSGGEGKCLLEGIPSDWPLLTWGPLAAYGLTTATGYGELLIAHRSLDNQWSQHMSPDKVVGPAVIVNRVGNGAVACAPCALDATVIQKYRVPEHRHLIRNLIRFLNPGPEWTVQAPVNVECIASRDEEKRRLFLHLVCFSGPATSTATAFPEGRLVLPPVMEEPMQYVAEISLRDGFKDARSVGKGEVEVDGQKIRLSAADVHEVVVIEG